MKKVLISIISVIAIIVILITGEKYWNEYQVKKHEDQVEKMIHGEEVKTELEHILKLLDKKALTPEGKIKSYKIDEDYSRVDSGDDVAIKVIINDDKDLTVKTALYKDSKRGALEHRAILTSEKLSGLLSDNGR
ncbi:DUF1310 family protein [Gemella haemolysans]|jgi:hypothetical protein|uniref:DUF1310 family protein n=2 Tax=Gemella haemolysans TaxID=1379 RepID=A0AA87DQM8_9BACL|nr:DUF1310 family protein [Gemella haemolysans]EGF87057.1 hypothetical protein HMPREF0428_01427 [Gemella haemolysans M341]QIX88886.1 DUF1310 family protein [Gemella haemolysans]